MIKSIVSKLLDVNRREITRLQSKVKDINALEAEYKKLKISDFPKKTQDFKKRIEKGEDLGDIMPDAYALVREASRRVLGMRPYDVQLMAAIALFEGKVAEQKTGEGKTLTAVPALYLRALSGKGAHLVTVNDYLARRDAGWNAPVFGFLGMNVGVIVQEGKSFVYDPDFNDTSHGDERLAHLKPATRKEAYSADITYGTNNEFGFDYLRDNMVNSVDQMVQRGHYFSIVDEVDSVLIDEARTPLIISAPDTDPTDKYFTFAKLVTKLTDRKDYTIDEKAKSASLTEVGISKVEKLLGVDNLYETDFESIHHIENALRARAVYKKDIDYVVKDGQIIIVDEFTGRLMFGRRWSDGMHQAVEAKEGVSIQQESKTLATISFQNYFRLYEHLAGMTGTAATEAEEFKKIYDLDVVVIPTNKPNARDDEQDVIYKTLDGKYKAIAQEIGKRVKKGQPVLVGTTSIEKNEIISKYLRKEKVPHNVLNAKNHEREALIIAEAGKPGAVTVATNMAGRGVDIVLGGAIEDKPDGMSLDEFKKTKEYKKWEEKHKQVLDAGGLHVIGTERHNSRRIDNQLRGRSGRQGDPGSTRFYLSLEDDLMRIFGGDQIGSLMNRLRLPENQPIENKIISRAIEQAQVKVEGHNFDMRKSVVEYDDVVNQQREIVYTLRQKILTSDDVSLEIKEKLDEHVDQIVAESFDYSEFDNKETNERLIVGMLEIIPFDDTSRDKLKKELNKKKDRDEVSKFFKSVLEDIRTTRTKELGEKVTKEIEKFAYLGSIDKLWIEHIDRIDDLKDGVRLRSYGQKDPIVEFKNEAFSMFENLMLRIDDELSRRIFRIGIRRAQQPIVDLTNARTNEDTTDDTGLSGGADVAARLGEPAFAKVVKSGNSQKSDKQKKIGRNDPCWCGSGKKWKKCHYPKTA